VIQYVGEVLEEEEYLRRKHYYIQTGQRHYYFMNIGNGEVIDACRKVRLAAATSQLIGALRHSS
jgi:histone-lysine N-methyltransferase SETD2